MSADATAAAGWDADTRWKRRHEPWTRFAPASI